MLIRTLVFYNTEVNAWVIKNLEVIQYYYDHQYTMVSKLYYFCILFTFSIKICMLSQILHTATCGLVGPGSARNCYQGCTTAIPYRL